MRKYFTTPSVCVHVNTQSCQKDNKFKYTVQHYQLNRVLEMLAGVNVRIDNYRALQMFPYLLDISINVYITAT